MPNPPTISFSLSGLPLESKQRHEALVGLFGQYLFSVRRHVLDESKQFAESQESRNRLGTLFRQIFDRASQMPSDQRAIMHEFCKTCLDSFIKELLVLLSNEGTDLRIAEFHAVRFRLDIEICDVNSGDIILEETLNRGGRFFADYWGQWLNRNSSAPGCP